MLLMRQNNMVIDLVQLITQLLLLLPIVVSLTFELLGLSLLLTRLLHVLVGLGRKLLLLVLDRLLLVLHFGHQDLKLLNIDAVNLLKVDSFALNFSQLLLRCFNLPRHSTSAEQLLCLCFNLQIPFFKHVSNMKLPVADFADLASLTIAA